MEEMEIGDGFVDGKKYSKREIRRKIGQGEIPTNELDEKSIYRLKSNLPNRKTACQYFGEER